MGIITIMERQSVSLLGVSEVCSLLGLSRPALAARREREDFPPPVARLAMGPVWELSDIETYARERASMFHERSGLERVARESARSLPPSVSVPLGDAAKAVGLPPRTLGALAEAHGVAELDSTGQVVSVRRDALGLLARVAGARAVELA